MSMLLLLGALLLAAAPTAATITGTVRDADTSRPVEGVIVALPDLERSTITAEDGRYRLADVPPGPHHLSFRAVGYAPRSLHALAPRQGELEIHVALRPEPVRLGTVRVRAPLTVRGVEEGAAYPDRAVSHAAVSNHPLLAEPDVLQALGGGEVVVSPEAPGGIHVRGGSSDQTAYLLDGIPVLSPYHAAGVSTAWNPDALSRVHLSGVNFAPASPHALSGAIEATTRPPPARLRAQATVSTTQARITLDGPLGSPDPSAAAPPEPIRAGYLVSLRSGMHDVIAPADDPSYLHGGTGDWLAKLESPLLGGRLRVLGYGNRNHIGSAASAGDTLVPRNRFEWHGRSLGGEWRREKGQDTFRILGWGAKGDASALWSSPSGAVHMDGARRDLGFHGAWENRSTRATTGLEARLDLSQAEYSAVSDSAGLLTRLDARTPVASLVARHAPALGDRLFLDLGASLSGSKGDLRLGPRARLRWAASPRLDLSASYGRAHQYAQSLRNPESIVRHVFPVDVYVGAGAPGVPVARSDQGVVAADWRPLAGVRLGLQLYERRSHGLLLVAPRGGEPFATAGFVVGSGEARGLAVEAAASSARLALLASYGWQRVRLTHDDSTYVPEHGAEQLLDAGVVYFPTTTTSLRLGATGAFGRRTTAIPGTIEWESCNLLDQGCEFAGSPHYGDEPLGATPLPAYLRLDLGLRQHWHVEIAGRDASIALFGTFTNLLARENLLTYARAPSGERVGIELRPAGVLVVGLDARF